MALSIGPALALAVLLGLLASGAVHFLDAEGDAKVPAWIAFALALLIVARDTLLGGRFWRTDVLAQGRLPGLELRDGQVRLRLFDFEPVATTLAIILGLLASGVLDFADGRGGASAWAWTAFALTLFLTLGGRLTRRPDPERGRRRREREERVRQAFGPDASVFWEDLTRRIFERRGRRDA